MTLGILVVDDEPDIEDLFRQRFRAELRRGELVFHFAASAEEALQSLNSGLQPEAVLVLSDINMPNMDGIEFLRQKSANAAIKGIPVVMITTEAGADILAEAKSLGAKGSIKKPFTPEQVSEVLGGLM